MISQSQMDAAEERQLARRRGEFELFFELQLRQREVLTLKLTCEESLRFYQLAIDQDYIQNHMDMATLFASPTDLLYTLEELFDELDLSAEGTITLKIRLNAARVNMTKVYVFKMTTSVKEELQFLARRVRELKEREKEEISQKQQEIEQLKEENAALEQQIRAISEDRDSYSHQIDSLTTRIEEINREKEQLNEALLSKEQAENEWQGQLSSLNKEVEDQRKEMERANNRIDAFMSFQTRVTSCLCDQNPQIYHFHYKYMAVGVRVTKKTENGWSNFISGWPIPEAQTTSFIFKQFKMRDGSLAIGIGSEAAFHNASLDHNEYIYYFCRDGKIYENGVKRINGRPIQSDQSVTVEVDRTASAVSWRSKEGVLGSASIPGGKKLYLMVKVFWKEDEFQLYF